MRLTLPQIALLHACKFVLAADEQFSPLEQYNFLRLSSDASNIIAPRQEFKNLTVDQLLKVIDELTAMFIEFNKNTTDYEKLI